MRRDEDLVCITYSVYEILAKEKCTIVEADKVLNLTKQLIDSQNTVQDFKKMQSKT